MVDFQTGNVVIEPKEEERYIEDASALQKKIESLPEVIGTSARLKSSGAFRYKEKEMGATVYGVDPTDESFVTGIEGAMISGEFLSKPDRGEIILGREVSGGFRSPDGISLPWTAWKSEIPWKSQSREKQRSSG